MLFKTIFKIIYESEINCRIEWQYDGGIVWSIRNNTYPRIWKDDVLDTNFEIFHQSTENIIENLDMGLKKDWIARGNEKEIDLALCKMYDAIIEHFPNSKASKWLKDFDENREHFFICQGCGDIVDKRDLGNVFEHEHGREIPVIIKKGKYIAKKQGDTKAWHKGNELNLN